MLKRLRFDDDCLFTKDVTLPNGNPEFDNGTSPDEARETIGFLISSLEAFDDEYFNRFAHFPSPLNSLGVDFVRAFGGNPAPEFGQYGATIFRGSRGAGGWP